MTTLVFRTNNSVARATFDIAIPCDGIVERIDNQNCSLVFGKIELPSNSTQSLEDTEDTRGRPAVVDITDCQGESKFGSCS